MKKKIKIKNKISKINNDPYFVQAIIIIYISLKDPVDFYSCFLVCLFVCLMQKYSYSILIMKKKSF